MNEQKDIQNIGLQSYGQDNLSDIKDFKNKPIYEFANKKTEKLVTALYMVTDCMEAGEALKAKLRFLAVELLSDMYKLSILSPVEKHTHITVSLSKASEIISFVDIASTIGFISEMNALILKREFAALISELQSHQAENQNASFGGSLFENRKISGFMLDKNMFEVSEKPASEILGLQRSQDEGFPLKDKRTSLGMSFINKNAPYKKDKLSSFLHANSGRTFQQDKKERADKIVSLIKDKKEVSIKDISIVFTECSEKTIQRELNSLVSKGQLKKTGAKRWSKYQIASGN